MGSLKGGERGEIGCVWGGNGEWEGGKGGEIGSGGRRGGGERWSEGEGRLVDKGNVK